MKKIPALILLGLLAAATASAAVIISSSDPAFEKLHKDKKVTYKLKKVKPKKTEGDTVAIDILENGVSISDGIVAPPPIPPPTPAFITKEDLKPGTKTNVGQNLHLGPWLHVTCPDAVPPKEPAKDAKSQPKPHLSVVGMTKGGTIEIEIDEAEQNQIIKFLKDNFKF